MSNPPWRIAIIEDHPDSCQALVDAVALMPDMSLAGTADDIDPGLALLQRTQPHVLVVDLGLPSGSGLALISGGPSPAGRCLCHRGAYHDG